MAIGPDIKRIQVYIYPLFIIAHSLFLMYQSNGSYQILVYNNKLFGRVLYHTQSVPVHKRYTTIDNYLMYISRKIKQIFQ